MIRTIIVVSFLLLVGEGVMLYYLHLNSRTNSKRVDNHIQLVTKYENVTATPDPYDTPHIISNTSEDEDIKKLKRRLIQLGWLKQGTEITGDFDEELKNAIRAMKKYAIDNWNSYYYGDADVYMPDLNIEEVDERTWTLIYKRLVLAPTPIPSPTIMPTPTKEVKSTGIWSLDYYVDEFGDKTDKPFISTGWINGRFSNTATTDSPLKARLFIDFSWGLYDVEIRLDEYSNGHIENMSFYKDCSVRVKDGNGNKLLLRGYGGKLGVSVGSSLDSVSELHDALMEGGTLQFVVKCDNSTYNFTINNADGYDIAYEQLVQTTQLIRETSTPKPDN